MPNHPIRTAALISCLIPFLISCGDKKEYTGQFIDAPVEGLRYSTDSQDGLTNEDGEFTYRRGETVHFYIGDFPLGRSEVRSVVTPLDLADTESYTNYQVINTARLLQTLDSNSGKTGLQISEQARAESGRLSGVSLTVAPTEFETDPRVLDFINTVTTSSTLIAQDVAIQALKDGVGRTDDRANDFEVTATARDTIYTGNAGKYVNLSGSVASGINNISSYEWDFEEVSPKDAIAESELELLDRFSLNDAQLYIPPYSSTLGQDVDVTLILTVKTDDGKQGWATTTITVCGQPDC